MKQQQKLTQTRNEFLTQLKTMNPKLSTQDKMRIEKFLTAFDSLVTEINLKKHRFRSIIITLFAILSILPCLGQNPCKLEIPATDSTEIIINHVAYSLVYNEDHEQAKWIAYELTKQETHGPWNRTNIFLPDPLIRTGTANGTDYRGSGYDRGHLAPAGDMAWSAVAMAESFYYSNISPQVADFNRGIWKKLESLVRMWAVKEEKIYLVTGAILETGLKTIGASKVSVPNYFYKVILVNKIPVKAIGFVLQNKGSSMPLKNFAVSVDSVERLTGINFFPGLNDIQEDSIESKICLNCWKW